jgi:hypothetical protein
MRARKNDPETSKSAAESIERIARLHYRAILLALSEMKDGTADEIADNCWLDKYQICRRLPEIPNYVRLTAQVRPTKTGRNARVWAITKSGLAFLSNCNKIR